MKEIVIAEYRERDYTAVLVQRDEGFVLSWTDGINIWDENWDDVSVALTRLAALIRAADGGTFLVHDVQNRDEGRYFESEAERFISRTVHASSCAPGCDGADPANHQVG